MYSWLSSDLVGSRYESTDQHANIECLNWKAHIMCRGIDDTVSMKRADSCEKILQLLCSTTRNWWCEIHYSESHRELFAIYTPSVPIEMCKSISESTTRKMGSLFDCQQVYSQLSAYCCFLCREFWGAYENRVIIEMTWKPIGLGLLVVWESSVFESSKKWPTLFRKPIYICMARFGEYLPVVLIDSVKINDSSQSLRHANSFLVAQLVRQKSIEFDVQYHGVGLLWDYFLKLKHIWRQWIKLQMQRIF